MPYPPSCWRRGQCRLESIKKKQEKFTLPPRPRTLEAPKSSIAILLLPGTSAVPKSRDGPQLRPMCIYPSRLLSSIGSRKSKSSSTKRFLSTKPHEAV